MIQRWIITALLIASRNSAAQYFMPEGLNVEVSDSFLIHAQDDQVGMGIGTHLSMKWINATRLMISYQQSGETFMKPSSLPWPLYSDDAGSSWKSGDPYTWTTAWDSSEMPTWVDTGEEPEKSWYGFTFGTAQLPPEHRLAFAFRADIRFAPNQYDDPYLYRIWSEDNGLTWHPPERSYFSMPDYIHESRGEFFKLSSPAIVTRHDGTLYMPAYGRKKSTDKHETLLFKSMDRGRNFTYVSTIATLDDADFDDRSHGPAEAAMLALDDHHWICVMRTGNKIGTAGISTNAEASDLLIARTYDAGLSWSRLRMRIQGVMPRLIRLENGVIVLGTGRPGNRLYFSNDQGRTWGGVVSLTPVSGVMTSGYLDFREIEANTLLVVYDEINVPLYPHGLTDMDDGACRVSVKPRGQSVPVEKSSKTNTYNKILGTFIVVNARDS